MRVSEKAEKLRALGINAVVGSHSEPSLMENLGAENDVVIAVVRWPISVRTAQLMYCVSQADADNLEAAQATLRGLKKRHSATGIPPIFIHTVGELV